MIIEVLAGTQFPRASRPTRDSMTVVAETDHCTFAAAHVMWGGTPHTYVGMITGAGWDGEILAPGSIDLADGAALVALWLGDASEDDLSEDQRQAIVLAMSA